MYKIGLSILFACSIHLSCNGGKMKVESVTLENVPADSGEVIEPPSSPSNTFNCNCDVVIDPDYKGEIMLYRNPRGGVINKMKHDFSSEDFLIARIRRDSGDYFFVNISYSISGNEKKGWIKKSQPVGIYSRNYNIPINLYEQPSTSAKVNASINWDPTLYKVNGCSGKWLMVTLVSKEKNKSGWLSPDMQCANPYTTCN